MRRPSRPPAVEIPIHFVESDFYLLWTPNGTLILPGLDVRSAEKAAAGHRCWETKVAKGTVLEPRGAGVADARGRRAASPPGGWVGKAKMKW